MRKISIVYHYFAHYREPVLRKFKEALEGTGQLELISGNKSDIPSLETIPIPVLKSISDRHGSLKNFWLGPFLWQSGLHRHLVQSSSTDVIFLGQVNFASTWTAVILCKLLNKKVYFWTHGVYGNESFLKRRLRFFFYSLADHVFLYGNHAKNILIDQGFDIHRLHVIYNSLDHAQQKELRSLLKESPPDIIGREISIQSPYIIFVGRLTDIKRLDILFKSIHQIRETYSQNINCLLVGDGPAKNHLITLASELSINHLVQFYGSCHEESILAELIYNANVCVSPGNVGLTAMHSLVYGTPVITHAAKEWQMPEFEAITSGKTGDFFERDNFEDLAEKIYNWVIEKAGDRNRIREDCFKIIDDYYNPDFQIATILRVIDSKSP